MNALGVFLAFLGSFMQGMGILLQKRAQSKESNLLGRDILVRSQWVPPDNEDSDEEEAPGDDELGYIKSPMWRAGFAIFLQGSILGFVSVGMIGPSLLVVISSSSLLTNVIFSPVLLSEARRNLDWASVFLIISGISLAITAIELSDKTALTVGETVECIGSKRARSTWASLTFLFLGMMLICRLDGKEPENKYVRAAFAVRAGLSGVMGVMLATPTSLLLQNPTLEYPVLLVLAACLIVQVVLDIHIQNRSLKFNGKNPLVNPRALSSLTPFRYDVPCPRHILRMADGNSCLRISRVQRDGKLWRKTVGSRRYGMRMRGLGGRALCNSSVPRQPGLYGRDGSLI